MPPEPHWFLKGLSAAVLGAISWIVAGLILNIFIPIVGLFICCQSLGPIYYRLAYWLPIILGLVVAAVILLAWAQDPDLTKSRKERLFEIGKAAMVVIGLCVLAVARNFGFI